MAFVRFLLLMLVVETIVYFSLLAYFRAARRERLAAGYPSQATDREREGFVERALDSYMGRLRPKLAAVVYGLPILLVAGYIYWSNFR